MNKPQPQMTSNDHEEAQAIAREFQDFAYIVSHYLQAPVRHVREFSRLLLKSMEDVLSDDQKSYAGFIESALRRLDKMHEALLAYSRIATRAGPPETITPETLIADVMKEIKKAGEPDPQLTISRLPPVKAEPQQLRMVFHALIQNAIRFAQPGSQPEITITAETDNSAILFTVRDNGIGIAPQFHKDIFKMFRRLHPPGQYGDGPGAGLTLAQKIVERHGGKIWVESQEGGPSAIRFSLPKA